MASKKPFPYDLPLIQKFRSLGASHFREHAYPLALEFFRIEALLRSETIMNKYENDPTCEEECPLDFQYDVEFGWKILQGAHAILLLQDDKPHAYLAQGIWDLSHWASEKEKEITQFFEDQKKQESPLGDEWKRFGRYVYLSNLLMGKLRKKENPEDRRELFLEIDLVNKPETIIKGLRPLIKKAHQDLIESRRRSGIYVNSRKKSPPTLQVKTWLDYFRCYDLRQCTEKSFSVIAKEVYNDTPIQRKTDQVQKAVKRVTTLIQNAESNNWPPSSGFLKQS